MLWAFFGVVVLALVLGPQLWVRRVMLRHSDERSDIPGTGGELARHLLDSAGLQQVAVDITDSGDHYDTGARRVRLTPLVFHGRSLTAVAVAAHEVGHALQHAEGQALLAMRTRLAKVAIVIERVASVVLLLAPVVALFTHAPAIFLLQLGLGVGLMSLQIVLHMLTLPVELDASFRRALPILENGRYVASENIPAVRQVLGAAAWTYVAAALVSLLNVMRWFRSFRI